MVNRRISSDLKERALILWEAGWSPEDIRYAFNVSPRSLYRWRTIFEEFGTVTKPPSPLRGRDRIISLGVLDAAKEIFFHDPSVMLDELQWHLAIHHDVAISISALQATLVRAGLTRKMMQKIAKERNEAGRDDYRACIRDPDTFSGTGLEFVTVDESSKDERTLARHYGRSPIGQPAIYSASISMSVRGYIAMRIVEGSMDAFEFFDFIVEDVIPEMNPYPDVQSVLVLDNCRIHHTDLLQEVLNENGIMVLYLPPYSPDLNPIEESFSTWKAYLRRHGEIIHESEDPIAALLESTSCITPEMAEGWFRHAGYIW
ncbi:Tc1-mariner class transposase [Mycena venus]|uniref:Tc1-mariner class transposase n=1 Tax=Mycena venus TaxID=2733690 RepID=A0A8H6Y5G5_9AGAR|nr:Tc1-mariner class transposase [Mycena venus]